MESFPAIVATENAPASLQDVPESSLPEGDVTVDVSWSSLNYKDGLAVTGKGRIVRSFPMVCGIDLAGTVRSSDSDKWSPGDEVVVTGWGLSETHPGGYTTRQRVRSEWLQARPEHLTLRETMAIGTGGLTAMLCILALEDAGIEPGSDGEVLVTGAGGGVGSFAVMLLANLGYRVAAATGRPEIADYLTELGATSIVGREELSANSGRPSGKGTVAARPSTRWGARRWPRCWPRPVTAAPWPRADWPAVPTCPPPFSRSFCATSDCWVWTPCPLPPTSVRPPGPAWTPTSPVTCSIWSPPRSHWPASRPWPNRSWRVRCAVGS